MKVVKGLKQNTDVDELKHTSEMNLKRSSNQKLLAPNWLCLNKRQQVAILGIHFLVYLRAVYCSLLPQTLLLKSIIPERTLRSFQYSDVLVLFNSWTVNQQNRSKVALFRSQFVLQF